MERRRIKRLYPKWLAGHISLKGMGKTKIILRHGNRVSRSRYEPVNSLK
jgi:hypothetical protein